MAAAVGNLPPGWAVYQDAEGRSYYANASTGETSWTPPVAPPAPPPAATLTLPEGWTEHKDPEGRSFYFNQATGVTSWDPPAAAPAAAPAAQLVAAAAPAATTGTWSLDYTYTLGGPGCESIFQGKAQMLDPNQYNSVATVVDALNAGNPAVPSGFCVVFSKSRQSYFLLWRSDAEQVAFDTLGLGDELDDSALGGWAVTQVLELGPVGSETFFQGRVELLDRNLYNSVSNAVEALNSVKVKEAKAGFCVVYSASQQAYYLLWREGKEGAAMAKLGLRDPNAEQ